MGREVGKLQAEPSFGESRYFYSEHYRNGTCLSIYLSSSFIHRQKNKNESFQRQHACHFYIFFQIFLFRLKHSLSFLFKIPSRIPLPLFSFPRFLPPTPFFSLLSPFSSSLLPSLSRPSRSPLSCFVPETLSRTRRWSQRSHPVSFHITEGTEKAPSREGTRCVGRSLARLFFVISSLCFSMQDC